MDVFEEIKKNTTTDLLIQYFSKLGRVEKHGKQWEVHGQGGLYFNDSCQISRPADGKNSGGTGILPAIIFTQTGKWDCSKEELNQALKEAADLTHVKLRPPPQFKKQKKKSAVPPVDFDRPTATYSYVDESGKELYQNCRYEWIDDNGDRQKTFRQRYKKDSKWFWNLNGQRRIPYNLPAIMQEPSTFFDVEGEKDVETLQGLGLVATSIGKDEKTWEAFAEFGKEKVIIVCEDHDPPGIESARKRAAFWYNAGATVKILNFRELPEKSDVTDWIEQGHSLEFLLEKLKGVPLFSPIADITVDFLHKPNPRAPIITISDVNILSVGGISGIISGIGRGKSHLMELIASEAIKPGCEPYSYMKVELGPDEKIVIVDTERPRDDCFYGLQRVWRRTGEDESLLTADRSSFKSFTFTTVTDIPDIATRRGRLLEIFAMPGLRLCLIDGMLDFVADPNNVEQCTELGVWLHAQAIIHDIGILYTIHGNRNDVSGKGKGWLGDALQRKSSSFLMLKEHEKSSEIRVLSSDFDNKKVRHGKDSGINIAMSWDEKLHAFSCVPYDAEDGDLSHQEIFVACFLAAGKTLLSYKELCHQYKDISKKSLATARRHIELATGVEIEKSQTSSLYSLREVF